MQRKFTSFMALAVSFLLAMPTLVSAQSVTSDTRRADKSQARLASLKNPHAISLQKAPLKLQEPGKAPRRADSDQVMTVPYIDNFTEATASLWTLIDANNDAGWNGAAYALGAWYIYTTEPTRLEYYYNFYDDNSPGDDWAISPKIQLQAGVRYELLVKTECMGMTPYVEQLTVTIGQGNTIEDQTTILIPTTKLANEEEDLEVTFMVPEDGVYNIGLYCSSPAWETLFIRIPSISIVNGPANEAPEAPVVVIEAEPTGEPTATVSVTAPARDLNGDALASLEKVVVYREGFQIFEQLDPTPGETYSFEDTNIPNGYNEYYSVAYNEYGVGEKSEQLRAYVGIDTPSPVTKINDVKMDTNYFYASWQKVGNKGLNGYPVRPEDVNYKVQVGEYYPDWDWFNEYKLIGSGMDIDEITSDFNVDDPYKWGDENQQEYFGMRILTSNDYGQVYSDASYYPVFVGKPYTDYPIKEEFKGQFNHFMGVNSSAEYDPSPGADWDYDLTRSMLNMRSFIQGEGWLEIEGGKMDVTALRNPALSFTAQITEGAGATVVPIIMTPDMDVIIAGTPQDVTNETTMGIKLAPYAEQYRWIRPGFRIYYNGPATVSISDFEVSDRYDDNLTLTVQVPTAVRAGNEVALKAKVFNSGFNAVPADEVTLVVNADDEELYNGPLPNTLNAFETATINLTAATSVFEESDRYITVTAKVSYNADQFSEDNTDLTFIELQASTSLQPTGVAGVTHGDGVLLTWDPAPVTEVVEVTEDFEDKSVFEPWSLGGIDSDNQNGAFGDWKLYDGNNMTVFRWYDYVLPNAEEVSAFQVFNFEQAAEQGLYLPHDSEQALLSMCPLYQGSVPPADHWLISPQLCGDAQTIKFQTMQISNQYGSELIEVLYSTTGTQTADFQLVNTIQLEGLQEWQEINFDVPAGAQYFAIRHVTANCFGLFVDDITYTPAPNVIQAFGVYVDKQRVATLDADATQYQVEDIDVNHEFAVSMTDSKGESIPVIADVKVDGISQVQPDGAPVQVYSVDGRRLNAPATGLNIIRQADGTIQKEVVR